MNREDKHALDVDMSERGISRRLSRLANLYDLAASLHKAKLLGLAEKHAEYQTGADHREPRKSRP